MWFIIAFLFIAATAVLGVKLLHSKTIKSGVHWTPSPVVIEAVGGGNLAYNIFYRKVEPVTGSSVAWQEEGGTRTVYKLTTTGEWYMGTPVAAPDYSAPDNNSSLPPRDGWVTVLSVPPAPKIDY